MTNPNARWIHIGDPLRCLCNYSRVDHAGNIDDNNPAASRKERSHERRPKLRKKRRNRSYKNRSCKNPNRRYFHEAMGCRTYSHKRRRRSRDDKPASVRKTVRATDSNLRATDRNLSRRSRAVPATHPATKSLRFSVVDSPDKNDENQCQRLHHGWLPEMDHRKDVTRKSSLHPQPDIAHHGGTPRHENRQENHYPPHVADGCWGADNVGAYPRDERANGHQPAV